MYRCVCVCVYTHTHTHTSFGSAGQSAVSDHPLPPSVHKRVYSNGCLLRDSFGTHVLRVWTKHVSFNVTASGIYNYH